MTMTQQIRYSSPLAYLHPLLHTVDLQRTDSLREGMQSQMVEQRRPSLTLLCQHRYTLVIQRMHC